jgi:hypothetical protein
MGVQHHLRFVQGLPPGRVGRLYRQRNHGSPQGLPQLGEPWRRCRQPQVPGLRREHIEFAQRGESRRQRHGERLSFGRFQRERTRVIEHQAALFEAQAHGIEAKPLGIIRRVAECEATQGGGRQWRRDAQGAGQH